MRRGRLICYAPLNGENARVANELAAYGNSNVVLIDRKLAETAGETLRYAIQPHGYGRWIAAMDALQRVLRGED